MTHPWLIGITGNIACGKSVVMRRLGERPANVGFVIRGILSDR